MRLFYGNKNMLGYGETISTCLMACVNVFGSNNKALFSYILVDSIVYRDAVVSADFLICVSVITEINRIFSLRKRRR